MRLDSYLNDKELKLYNSIYRGGLVGAGVVRGLLLVIAQERRARLGPLGWVNYSTRPGRTLPDVRR